MKKTTFVMAVCFVMGAMTSAFAGKPAPAGQGAGKGPTCGQMIASKAIVPTKIAEATSTVAEMMENHIRLMDAKNPAAMKEIEALKGIAQQHRDMAALMTKTAEAMSKMASLPGAPHDMKKFSSDPKMQEVMKKMLAVHKDLAELMQKQVAELEQMQSMAK